MPSRVDIQQEISQGKSIKHENTIRQKYLKELSGYTGRDTIIYSSAWTNQAKSGFPGSFLSVNNDDVDSFMAACNGLSNKNLDLILHSPGGSPGAAEQILSYLRSRFDNIRAIVPQNAMSAATMLACGCNDILLGKHSALGPTDPQMSWRNTTSSAHSILSEFEQARKEIVANPQVAAFWVPRIKDYPPGIFDACKKAQNLSLTLVENSLKKYMFSDDSDNETKAVEIATWLSDAEQHLAHGKPLGYETLKSVGLNVTLLEEDQSLQDKVLSVFHAINIGYECSNMVKIVEGSAMNGKIVSAKAN